MAAKKFWNKCAAVLSAAVVAASLFGAAACGKADDFEYQYNKDTAEMVHFDSSDKAFTQFLDDMNRRMLSYDDEALFPITLGEGSWFGKDWESQALSYFDVSETTLGRDHDAIMTGLFDSRVIDRYGYVWNGWHELEDPTNPNPGTMFMQGWPFPHAGHSYGEITEWEFRDEEWATGDYADSANWKTYRDGEDVSQPYSHGMLSDYTTELSDGATEEIVFESEPRLYYETFQAPFLELDVRLTDLTSFGADSSLADIQVQFQTEEGGDQWFTASQMDYCTRPLEQIPASYSQRMYFALYLHDDYLGANADGKYTEDNSQTIMRYRVVFKVKEGETFVGSVGLNYVRMGYDTRQPNNQEIYITAVKNMFLYNGDREMLQKYLGDCRRAMMFYLEFLGGKGENKQGALVDCEYMVGHDGYNAVGHGIGNGYWDVQMTPAVNLYTNEYFYKALNSLIELEEIAAKEGISVGTVSVQDREGKDVAWDYSVDELKNIRANIKALMEKDVDEGGFWNPNTKRFVLGVHPYPADDTDASKYYDYGYTYYNLEAVYVGIGTEQQQKDVMDWITGRRLVAGDAIQGEDIYEFRFAPVSNTVDGSDNYFWPQDPYAFGTQVQNGGAIFYLSYYDLVMRNRIYGIDDAFGRFKEIQQWYNEVQAAGGSGQEFFLTYYLQFGIFPEGWAGPSVVGLDTVFMENSIVTVAAPEIFLGTHVVDYSTVGYRAAVPTDMDYFKTENLTFRGAKYDVSVGHGFFRLDSVRNASDDLKVEIAIPCGDGGVTVTQDGKTLASSAYQVKDGYVIMTVALKDTVITVE